MKLLLYALLVLLIVPLQTTLLPHLSVWNVKPDLGLVAAVFVGLFAGEVEGLMVGLSIGWLLSLFSAGELWLSLFIHGGVGLLAGFLGRQMSHVTSVALGAGVLLVSLLTGLLAVANSKNLDVAQIWWLVESMVLPQACFDALIGAGLYGLLAQRFDMARLRTE